MAVGKIYAYYERMKSELYDLYCVSKSERHTEQQRLLARHRLKQEGGKFLTLLNAVYKAVGSDPKSPLHHLGRVPDVSDKSIKAFVETSGFFQDAIKSLDGAATEEIFNEAMKEAELYFAPDSVVSPHHDRPAYTEEMERLRDRVLSDPNVDQDRSKLILSRAAPILIEDYCAADSVNAVVEHEKALDTDRRKKKVDYLSKVGNEYAPLFRENELGNPVLRKTVDGNVSEWSNLMKLKLNIDDGLKTAFIAIMDKMNELGLVPTELIPGEQTSKVYVFKDYIEARGRLVSALNKEKNDEALEEIKTGTELIEELLPKYRQIYDLARELVPNASDIMVCNVDNMRNPDIPSEFKNDYHLNAVINGLFILANLAKANSITPQELMKDPDETLRGILDGIYEKYRIENDLKAGAGAMLAKLTTMESNAFPFAVMFNLSRAYAAVAYATTDPEKQAENLVSEAAFDGLIKNVFVDMSVYSDTRRYEGLETSDTFMRLLLLPAKDVNVRGIIDNPDPYLPLTVANEKLDVHALIREGRTTPDLFLSNLMDITRDFIDAGGSSEVLINFIEAARDVAEAMIFTTRPEERTATSEMLENFYDKPSEFVDKQIATGDRKLPFQYDTSKKLSVIDAKYSGYDSSLKSDRSKFMKLEAAYDKKADAIIKRMERLNAKALVETDRKKLDRAQADIMRELNKLKELQAGHEAKLNAAVERGTVTPIYRKARMEDILSLNHARRPSMYLEGFYGKDEFMSRARKSGKSPAEIDRLYERMLAKEARAKAVYYYKLEHGISVDIEAPTGNFEKTDMNVLESELEAKREFDESVGTRLDLSEHIRTSDARSAAPEKEETKGPKFIDNNALVEPDTPEM